MSIELLKDLYNKIESLRGKKLALTLLGVAIVSILIGFTFNYFIVQILKSNEIQNGSLNNTNPVEQPQLSTYQGKITFIEPLNFPQDDISFFLSDAQGKRIILLTADDQKLQVSEGLYVEVAGILGTTISTQEEVLRVETVTIKNDL